jgi:hypothetical protein
MLQKNYEHKYLDNKIHGEHILFADAYFAEWYEPGFYVYPGKFQFTLYQWCLDIIGNKIEFTSKDVKTIRVALGNYDCQYVLPSLENRVLQTELESLSSLLFTAIERLRIVFPEANIQVCELMPAIPDHHSVKLAYRTKNKEHQAGKTIARSQLIKTFNSILMTYCQELNCQFMARPSYMTFTEQYRYVFIDSTCLEQGTPYVKFDKGIYARKALRGDLS